MNFLDRMNENEKQLNDRDEAAKAKGDLKGRYIREGYADGYAIYEIIRVNKKSVRIRVVTGIGDDWRIPYWGDETTIPLEYALQNIKQRDFWSDLAAAKAKSQTL